MKDVFAWITMESFRKCRAEPFKRLTEISTNVWLTTVTDVLCTENIAGWDHQSLLSATTAQVRPVADTGVSADC